MLFQSSRTVLRRVLPSVCRWKLGVPFPCTSARLFSSQPRPPVSPSPGRAIAAGDLVQSADPWLWAFNDTAYKKRCAHCFQERGHLHECPGCRVHRYCSTACQEADWKKEHEVECALIKGIESNMDKLQSMWALFGLSRLSEHDRMPATFVLLAKLAHKVKENAVSDIPDLGQLPAKDIVNLFRYRPILDPEDPVVNFTNMQLSALGDLLGTPGSRLADYSQMIHYDAFPIRQPSGTLAGVAMYPTLRYRAMTPVCLDVNVTMGMHGRRLMVFATEDIPNYTGLRDLRCNVTSHRPYAESRESRRNGFEYYNLDEACTCQKCTREFEAEMNPLQCVTPGCIARIPSDARAVKPCPQCGANNSGQLLRFHRLEKKLDNARKDEPKTKPVLGAITGLIVKRRGEIIWKQDFGHEKEEKPDAGCFKEVENAGILQSDAHLRYVYGWDVKNWFADLKHFEDDWKLMQEMVACVRKFHPRYELTRAARLMMAANYGSAALAKVKLEATSLSSELDRIRLESAVASALPIVVDYAKEARDIFAKLYGEDSSEVKNMDHMLASCPSGNVGKKHSDI
ncbi:uncharacterized protein LOC129597185 [Paramacrobiotus metropolitanus]|uniref:uncharacterized protein LOC129597185 n=1 Tax=Paramacrobiotus metropolitanus TaxID=2943436 RepID=UPI002445B0C5|nr:uncharacterized protein LOC129597185 [Paramacrobiotus metropolitanus]